VKKIDLHIHTIATPSDSDFQFDLAKLVEYVNERKLDIIAVTNHNTFDEGQYRTIAASVSCLVIPGIEVDLEGGHILVLADPTEVQDFSTRCNRVSSAVPDATTTMDIASFQGIFPDLSRFIAIPHYDKSPALPKETIERLGVSITAGEVTSIKKFIYCIKDPPSLVPVFFSDSRMRAGLPGLPIRQTFVDIGEITFPALKYALSDKNKVSLSDEEGHKFFQATSQGLLLSTGLNVILGERSSGKTWTLNALEKNFERVKYLRQFSLVEKSDDADAEKFNEVLREGQSTFIEGYLKELKSCVEDVVDVDLEKDDRELSTYLSSLLKNATEFEKADVFSKATLFNETGFPEESLGSLEKLIDAAMLLADNAEYRQLIDAFVPLDSLKSLAVGLIKRYNQENELRLKRIWANDLIASIKSELQRRTASELIPDIDFYELAMNKVKVGKFKQVCLAIRQEREIYRQDVQAYRIVANTRQFGGAGELQKISKSKSAFSTAYQYYPDPYKFLKGLAEINGIPEAEFYRYFVAIDYRILNKHGAEVSGGERSEFRLLQAIRDALQYDMLLIDEPESSFDNVFLNSDVNRLIKDISRSMPVVVVTHNSTVGASVKPDYVVHTKRFTEAGRVSYESFAGHPTDKTLKSASGAEIPNHEVMMNCLEAGVIAYGERRSTYETLKN